MSRKKEAILEASKQLFIEKGIVETGMEDIAAFIPVSKMTIYSAFGNKEGLVEAVIDRMIDDGFKRFENARAEATDPLDALRKLSSYSGIETKISQKFLTDLKMTYPRIMKKLVLASDAALPRFQQLILDAQQKGQIRSDLSPIIISSFIQYLNEFITKAVELNGFGNPHMIKEQITSILYYGILS